MTKDEVDDVILRVYRARLDAACPGDADRQLAKVGPSVQRSRAEFYRGAVTETLVQVGLYVRPMPKVKP